MKIARPANRQVAVRYLEHSADPGDVFDFQIYYRDSDLTLAAIYMVKEYLNELD